MLLDNKCYLILTSNDFSKFQQRLPYDLLSSLAHCLLDNTTFEIMQELGELQHMTEKILHKQHAQMVNKHKSTP